MSKGDLGEGEGREGRKELVDVEAKKKRVPSSRRKIEYTSPQNMYRPTTPRSQSLEFF